MKKKVILAVLAVCVALGASACSGSSEKESDSTKTETEASSEGEEDAEEETDKETDEEPEAEEESEDTKTDKKSSDGATRLVSVKDIDQYITIGEYKGLALNNVVEAVTDDDVDAQLEVEMQNHAEEVTDSKETVQEGDLVTIDFVGTKDGTAFDGGTASNYDLVVGEGGMIDGFEDGIVGMKKGETKDLPLTFPEDYFSEEMAGQDVVFQITLQNFRRTPELTDEWVAANLDMANVEEYKESIRTQLEETAAETAKYQMYAEGWNTVLENSEVIEFPEEEIENCIAEYKKQIEVYASQADMDLTEFVESQGYTEESFEDECRQYAEYKVKQNLIVQGIMDAESISLDDEECLALQDELMEAYGAESLADLIDLYGQVAVDESIGLLRVEQFIADNAEITDQVSDGDTVGVNGDLGDTSEEYEEESEDSETVEETEEAPEEEAAEEETSEE